MKDEITLAIFNPQKQEREDTKVPCEVVGSFAIHKSFNEEECFAVTHRNTGFACVTGCPSIESAKHAARLFDGLGNIWNFDNPDHVKTWKGKLMHDIRAIKSEARAGAES